MWSRYVFCGIIIFTYHLNVSEIWIERKLNCYYNYGLVGVLYGMLSKFLMISKFWYYVKELFEECVSCECSVAQHH